MTMYETFPDHWFKTFPDEYFMKSFRRNITYFRNGIHFYNMGHRVHLSEAISRETLLSWRSNFPVFISAQTGSGKNYFIQHVLLNMLVDQNPYQKDVVLFLSNRVALNRESKKQLADYLVDLTGDIEYKKAMEQFYTSEGIDKFCYRFGIITVCSYQQIAENTSINLSSFKYIICDECHFFTSDATFNPNTNEILKKIIREGHSAIRIYMSATPEIAFQPIVSCEFKTYDPNNSIPEYLHELRHWTAKCSTDAITASELSEDFWTKKNYYESHYPEYFTIIQYYHLARNYDYLQNIFVCEDFNESLIKCIIASKEKWLIFVQSQNAGERLQRQLNESQISATVLSRNLILTNELAREEFNYIIDHETIKSRIVITTSIIDNGINIRNTDSMKDQDKVLNVAIDSFNRVQFLQMLGRVRVNSSDNIRLFIKRYSIDDVKSILRNDAELLLKLLENDMLSRKGKQHTFNPNLFRFTGDPETFSEYNPCAIYQLIDNMFFLIQFIRKSESDFYLNFKSDNLRAQRARVYQYYRAEEGQNKPWSKSILDIFETPETWANRTFQRASLKNHWHPFIIRINWYTYESAAATYNSSFKDTIYHFFDNNISTEFITDLDDPLSLQLHWIDKNLSDCKTTDDFINRHTSASSINDNLKIATLQEIIQKYSVTENEINQHRVGEKKTYVDKKFLNDHGVLKDSYTDKYISEKFFGGTPFKELLRSEYSLQINNTTYTLQSFGDNSNAHKTYYIFVCS